MGASTKAGVPPGTVPVRGQVGDMLGPVPPGVTPLSEVGGQLRDALGLIGAAGIPPVALIRGLIEKRNPAEIAMENATQLGLGMLGYLTPPLGLAAEFAGLPEASPAGRDAADLLAYAMIPGLTQAGSHAITRGAATGLANTGTRLRKLAEEVHSIRNPQPRFLYQGRPSTIEEMVQMQLRGGPVEGVTIVQDVPETLVQRMLAKINPDALIQLEGLLGRAGQVLRKTTIDVNASGKFADDPLKYSSAPTALFTAARLHRVRDIEKAQEKKKNER